MRILITGSRNWADEKVIEEAISTYTLGRLIKKVVVVHGDCPTGADAMADKIAKQMGFRVEVYPADWNKHGRAAGPIRNQQMVDLGADICLAFVNPESRGTKHCMQRAKAGGIEVKEYHSNAGI